MTTAKPATYASIIRKAMIRKELTRRKLEALSGYSYEHIRKVVNGMPLMSEAFNDKICGILGLDVDEMWEIAKREKAKHSHIATPDIRFQQFWGHLLPSDQEQVLNFARSLADERLRQQQQFETPDEEKTPEQIREKINRLTDTLVKKMSESVVEQEKAHRRAHR